MAFDDEGSSSLGHALPLLSAALELGGRAAERDPAGAYDLYACAARLARRVRGLGEVADFRLERALDESESRPDAAARADALRDGIDSLLPDGEAPDVPDDPLEAMQRFIELAISIGAPAYNLGDHQGCFDVYSCTARMILATVAGADAARVPLQQALDQSATHADCNKQAWAMRHGFDAVLGMGRASEAVPVGAVGPILNSAILIGAPAFDLGDCRGCYEIYACTARLLLHGENIDGEIKTRLAEALREACVVPDVARQAWILRRAFDSILGG